MVNFQNIVITLLLLVTAGFLSLAQTSNAAKGPKITNKVDALAAYLRFGTSLLKLVDRSTSILHMEMKNWVGS